VHLYGCIHISWVIGYCSAGYYATTAASTSCSLAPAGYYKPLQPFTDNYYICSAGYYSAVGASVCTACPSSTAAGTSYCMFPTSQPSSQPYAQPTRQPTAQPSRQPTRQPTGQPSRQPTAQPTRQPTRRPTSQPTRRPSGQPTSQPSTLSAALCKAGTYYTGGSCILAPGGIWFILV
jgi:hypothetical protein